MILWKFRYIHTIQDFLYNIVGQYSCENGVRSKSYSIKLSVLTQWLLYWFGGGYEVVGSRLLTGNERWHAFNLSGLESAYAHCGAPTIPVPEAYRDKHESDEDLSMSGPYWEIHINPSEPHHGPHSLLKSSQDGNMIWLPLNRGSVTVGPINLA